MFKKYFEFDTKVKLKNFGEKKNFLKKTKIFLYKNNYFIIFL
jgi:hypothetical protein